MRRITLASLLLATACGGDSAVAPPPPPVPTNVILTLAHVVENADWSSDRVTVFLRNTGGKGDYYLEFWGFPIPTSPTGCFVGQPCPQPIQREITSTATVPVSLSYQEQLVYQLPPVITAVKVFSRSDNSAIVRESDCENVRDFGVCP